MIRPRSPQTAPGVARHYDQLDPLYRELWGEHLHHGWWERGDETAEEAVRSMARLVAHRARIGSGDWVLDVGCGYGATARMLAAEYGARVTGLTLSESQYRYASSVEPGADNPVYLRQDWLAWNAPPGAADAVLMVESSEHMADKLGAFQRARAALRAGGRLVICAWLAAEGVAGWRRRLLEGVCSHGRLAGMGTEREYRSWLTHAGLRLERVDNLTERVRRTWSVVLGRAARGLATRPGQRAFLFDRRRPERVFALALPALWLGYRTGAMRYGVFTAVKGGLLPK